MRVRARLPRQPQRPRAEAARNAIHMVMQLQALRSTSTSRETLVLRIEIVTIVRELRGQKHKEFEAGAAAQATGSATT